MEIIKIIMIIIINNVKQLEEAGAEMEQEK